MANYKLIGDKTHLDFDTIEEVNGIIFDYAHGVLDGSVRVIDMQQDIELEVHWDDRDDGEIIFMEVIG
jgi:hypothetical protein